jgi:tetratricopeptide (TPR) repeat protein
MNATLKTRGAGLAGGAAMLLALVLAHAASADDLKDGRSAFNAGRYDDAARLFEKAASQGSAEGRAGVGQVWLRRRQLGKAMEAFELAQKMDPNLALAYYGQGEVLRRQNKCPEALPLLRKATELDRKFPEAQIALGECYVATQKHQEATEALNRGLNWGPKWRPRFLVALGDAELARDSLRDAGIFYTKAREESPEDPTPRRALGDFYVKRGTFELAVPEYQAAIEKDTSDIELRYKLGQAMFYAQRYNEALDVWRDVVARDPEFAAGQLSLGDLYYRSGQADARRYHDAKPPLEKYVQLAPEDPRGWSVLGRTLYHLGERDAALAALDKAVSLGDKSKDMHRARFRLFVDRREYDKALAEYALADPEPEDQLRMAQVLVIQKQPAQAESLYRALVSQDESGRHGKFALNELGKIRFREKDYPGAIGYFERRNALDPKSDEAYYFIGLSYKEMKETAKAIEAMRQSVALAPDKPDRHFWLGILYTGVPDSTAEARTALNRAVELDSAGTSKNTGIALRQLGYYDLLAKNWPEAIRKLERAVQIDPNDWQAWLWLAQGYQNSGNRSKACECYRRVLQLKPGQPEAVQGMKALGC